jgi:hypothetical protein
MAGIGLVMNITLRRPQARTGVAEPIEAITIRPKKRPKARGKVRKEA